MNNLNLDVLIEIAGYLAPQESISFGSLVGTKNGEEPLDTTSISWSPQANPIQETLLFESQYRGMIDVLRNGRSKLSYDEINTLFTLQRKLQETDDTLLLSGSSMVQAMTGLRFPDSDLDFYVNAWGIRSVRATLKSLGFVCQKISRAYMPYSFQSPRLGIHHVETYVRPETRSGKPVRTVRAGDIKKVRPNRNPYAMYRRRAVASMKGVFEFDEDFPFTKTSTAKCPKTFDIIVANCDTHPQDIIDKFDFHICKSLWTGTTFLNPNGHKTYQKETGWDADWGSLVNNYLPAYIPQLLTFPSVRIHPKDLDEDSYCNWKHGKIAWIMRSFCEAAHQQGGQIPCIQHGFDCTCSEHAFNNKYYLKLHSHIMKRLKRMLKYASRGIAMPLNKNVMKAFFPDEENTQLVHSFVPDEENTQLPPPLLPPPKRAKHS